MSRSHLLTIGLLAAALFGADCDSGTSQASPDASGGAGGGTDAGVVDAAADAPNYGDAMALPDATVDVDAATLPDCGPGCRLALKRPVVHAAWGHGFSETWVADTNQGELFFAQVGSDKTFLVPRESAFARVNGDHISYVEFEAWPRGAVSVVDATNLTSQVYFAFEDSKALGFTGTFLTDKHVIWSVRDGLFKADLKTGIISQLSTEPLECREGCTADGAIYCVNAASGRVDRVDETTGVRTAIDDGGYLQTEGACSPDREQLVWVDYRHPPGQNSSLLGARGGSEVYVHDIAAKTTRRLTSDSPDSPVAKVFATVGSDLAVWREPCESCAKSFDSAGELYLNATRLVRYDLISNKRCHLDGQRIGGYMSLHGHHLYGGWTDNINQYIVDLDLDDPAHNWICD